MYKVKFITEDRVSGEYDLLEKVEITDDKVILTDHLWFETHITKGRLANISIEYDLNLNQTQIIGK